MLRCRVASSVETKNLNARLEIRMRANAHSKFRCDPQACDRLKTVFKRGLQSEVLPLSRSPWRAPGRLGACLFACLPVCVPLRSPHTRRAWVCDATGVGSDTLRLRRRMSRHGVEAARPLVDEAPVTHASRAFRPAQRPRAHAPCFLSHACTPLQPGPGPARRRQMTAPAKDSRR